MSTKDCFVGQYMTKWKNGLLEIGTETEGVQSMAKRYADDYDDDEENVDLETTKTGEVYIFI